MSRALKIAGASLLLGVGAFVASMLYDAGVFKTIERRGGELCQALTAPGFVGPEDMVATSDGRLVISVNDRLEEGGLAPGSFKDGSGLFILAADGRDLKPVNLPPEVAATFHPHGMDLYTGPSGEEIISVINHHPNGERIEQFLVLMNGLSYLRTIEEPYPGANDLVMIDRDHFYVTIDHGARTKLGRKLEDYSRLGRGFVAYFDGTTWRDVAPGFSFANGISKLADGKHLAVAEMLRRRYKVFRIEADGSLNEEFSVFVGSGIDNLTTAADGSLWIASHPKLLSLAAMNKDRARRAPAQVWRVSAPLQAQPIVEEVYLDDGHQLAAASVALHHGSHLFIGSVFDDHMLVCAAPN